MSTTATFTTPAAALAALLDALTPLPSERVAWSEAVGRVLASPIVADRDSPAHDVSAMDGYALRLADLKRGTIRVAGEIATGAAPPALPPGAALRIFTGGCVPAGAEAVVRREDFDEAPERVRLLIDPARVQPGQNIRRQGENVTAGQSAIEPGIPITPTVVAAMSSFGVAQVSVTRSVRVTALVTGNEVLGPGDKVQPWQVRDANGPALQSLLAPVPWADWQGAHHGGDDRPTLARRIAELLERNDALLITGGVSMGDHDYVPEALADAGARVVFHKLPIRPGKPLLAAVGPRGQAILGLPGNPVSVSTTARRFAVPALLRLAGLAEADVPPPTVEVVEPDDKTIPLWWYRAVRRVGAGRVALVPGKGSGDVVAAARADGFIEVEPDQIAGDPRPFWNWRVDD